MPINRKTLQLEDDHLSHTPHVDPILQPGTLWDRVIHQTQAALQSGALQPIATQSEVLQQGEIKFLVRILAHFERKEAWQRQQGGRNVNPFLPYDPDLFVADLTPTHLCLLNKFNVVDHHLLIVTRAFEPQEDLLNPQDFTALWLTLQEVRGLGFYNSGKRAGASQPHKHLQLVPLPLTPEQDLPIAALLQLALQAGTDTLPSLPFVHAFTPLALPADLSPPQAGLILWQNYLQLRRSVGWEDRPQDEPPPYNLLITREWMLLVPRTAETCATIAVNALGFAGAMLVRNLEQLDTLKAIGPLSILAGVAIPKPADLE
uniref:Ap4A phosphorylase II n=1 Tax=Cyanothece sp. (strain PCC 7425 / ATCC 29141) TaxID=395961 RepID=B8HXI7_CYAP4